MLQKKQIVKALLEKDVLITEQILNNIPEQLGEQEFFQFLSNCDCTDEQSILQNLYLYFSNTNQLINTVNVLHPTIPQPSIPYQTKDECGEIFDRKVRIITNFAAKPQKRSVQDFVTYYNKRYQQIKQILLNRMELASAISITRAQTKVENEQLAIITIITEKTITKNNNIILKAEDPTGEITVFINKNRLETIGIAKNLVLDEVIGVTGSIKNKMLYANTLFLPDIPLGKELKKAPEEEYALFLSDIHVGSRFFLEGQFKKFIAFLNGNSSSGSHQQLVPKIKYIFFVGDLVDGIGIYPAQEKELILLDIREQYIQLASLLAQIPKQINLIICPGNHDAVRLCEPQPILDKEIAQQLYALENTFLVSNPAIVNIAATDTFPGLDVLMYHGYSFDYFISNIDEIRNNGGYDRADLIMKFLLQKRHLAPTHAATLYVPDTEYDPLVITKVPDIFCTGHIHKVSVSNYRNITLVSGSCWQDTTKFQEKMGHHPEPCRVPMINLQTREVRILKF